MFSEAKVTEFFCIARNFSLNSCERCILHRTLLRSNRLYVRESVKDVSEKRIIEEDELYASQVALYVSQVAL